MSSLSGFDSDAVGFESVSQRKRQETTSATQTTEFFESGTGSQTNFSKDCGSLVSPCDLNAEEQVLREYPPPGLNAFLRKVVPGMLEQLDQNDREMVQNSSDSEEEEVLQAKLLQTIAGNADSPEVGRGDHPSASILSLSWSSAGRSLALSVGHAQHDQWCSHAGRLRVYSERGADGQMEHQQDISAASCITVVLYHPSVAALLAYGTSCGTVSVVSVRSAGDGAPLSAPDDAHGTRRVSALHWADAPLANMFLTMQIQKTGKRRSASDQILVSSGADGTINVWQVNISLRIFSLVVCCALNASRKTALPDISCFDFIKTYPLRPCDEKVPDDIFVVGSITGRLYLCGVRGAAPAGDASDPVRSELDAMGACVLRVAFSAHRPGAFVALSADAELRLYHIDQPASIKVFCLDEPASCLSWLPNNSCMVVLGLCAGECLVRVCDARSGRAVAAAVGGGRAATALAVHQTGSCRIACGDAAGVVHVWELPARRIRLTPDDLEF